MAEKKQKPLTREDVLKAIKKNGGTAKGLDLSGKRFEDGIDLRGLELDGIILREAYLILAHLEEAHLSDAHLEKADLTGAHLEGAKPWFAHLKRAILARAHLEGAELWGADLKRANLGDANLEGAELWGADLEGAELWGADLKRAKLGGAHLQEAILLDANLREAYLENANLQGADLERANLEGAFLAGAKFSSDTRLGNVDWGNYILGEEKIEQFNTAVAAYRQLKVWYMNAGIHDIAAKFYYREKEANRKSLKLCSKKNWNNRLAAEFMRAFFGYGEEWKRIFGWIAVVIFGLAGVYHLWGSFSSSSFWDTLYYSAASFTALGYGQWAPQPTGWAKGMGAAEAVVGVFMMALLLVTFVRKWTR